MGQVLGGPRLADSLTHHPESSALTATKQECDQTLLSRPILPLLQTILNGLNAEG